MARAIRMRWEPVRRLAFGSIGAGYTAVGTSLAHPAQGIILQNFTDAEMTFSFNGIDDHIDMAPQTSMVLDIASNKTIDNALYQAQGDTIWVKQTAAGPSLGGVSISSFYGQPQPTTGV
jgi:hypothetical protein